MTTPPRRRSSRAAGCALSGLVVLAISLSAAPSMAEPAPAYADLLARLDQTPVASEARALIEAADARVRQAAVRPNPVLDATMENFGGTGPYSGFKSRDVSLSLSQNLEWGGRRPARIGLSRAEAEAQRLRGYAAVNEGAARLALAYAEAEAAQRRATLAEEALNLALADARAALALVEQGREPLLRGIQAESEAAAARAALDEARAEKEAAFSALQAVAQLPEAPTAITASLLDAATPAAALTALTPAVAVAEAEEKVAERRILTERAAARPDLTASVGVTRMEAERATALTVGLSLPLPLFDRNRGNIDAARAEYRAAQARLVQARQDAGADRAAARSRLAASGSRVAASDSGVTSTEEAYRLSRLGADAGRISQLELRVSRAALINARTAAVEARMARVRAEIDLARLEGRAPFQGAD